MRHFKNKVILILEKVFCVLHTEKNYWKPCFFMMALKHGVDMFDSLVKMYTTNIITTSNHSAQQCPIASTSTDDPSTAQIRKYCQVINHKNKTSTMCHMCNKAYCGPCTKMTNHLQKLCSIICSNIYHNTDSFYIDNSYF